MQKKRSKKDETLRSIPVYMPQWLHSKLAKESFLTGKSMSGICNTALTEYFENKKSNKKTLILA